jgi:excisionase family DNA binding protein
LRQEIELVLKEPIPKNKEAWRSKVIRSIWPRVRREIKRGEPKFVVDSRKTGFVYGGRQFFDTANEALARAAVIATQQNNNGAAPRPRVLLSVKEVAQQLGRPPWFVYSEIGRQRMAHHKIGGGLLVSRADLDAYVERNRQPARGEKKTNLVFGARHDVIWQLRHAVVERLTSPPAPTADKEKVASASVEPAAAGQEMGE